MARFRTIKNSFLGGQISPTATGRTDLPQYAHACELLRNMIPMISGGAYRRPGTVGCTFFTGSIEHPPRLIPFIFSQTESYAVLLEKIIGAGTSIFSTYRVSSSGAITTGTCTGTLPYTHHIASDFISSATNVDDERFQVQFCQSADTLFLAHPKQKPQVIRRTALDTFKSAGFDTDATGTKLTGDALGSVYPFLNQNTTALKIQIDVATVGTGRNITFSSATGSPLTGTSTDVGTFFRIYGGTTVGLVEVTAATDTTHAVVKVHVAIDAATTDYTTWWESAWSTNRGWPRSVCIFQQRLCYGGTTHQPDTCWFSNTANYQTFSVLNSTAPAGTVLVRGASIDVAGGVIHYPVDDSQGNGQTTGPTGGQPFRITLSQNALDQIQWLSPDKELLVGTLGQEWIISPQNGDFSIQNSPTVVQSRYGSDYLMAQRIGYELVFPMATQDEVRAYQYNYIDASFFAEPVQLLFDQYPLPEASTFSPGRRKFRWIEWDVTRQTLWCLDTAGNFFGMTRDRKLQVTMWHTHQFGGFDTTKGVGSNAGSGSGQFTDPAYYTCDGSVISFCCVPNPFTGMHDVFMIVKRTVGGSQQWHLDRMTGKNTQASSVYSGVYPVTFYNEPTQVDAAALKYDSGDGLLVYSVGAQLNGYSVVGNYYSPTYGMFKLTATVSGGIATLTSSLPADYGANVSNAVVLGLSYTSIIQPVRLDVGSVIGSAQGALKGISEVFVRFYKTIHAKLGSAPSSEDQNSPEDIAFLPSPVSALGKSPELFTGDKKVLVPTTYERDGYLYLQQDQPFPFTVIAIITEGVTFDE